MAETKQLSDYHVPDWLIIEISSLTKEQLKLLKLSIDDMLKDK